MSVSQREQDFIFDLVPDEMVIWEDEEELKHFGHATYEWWRKECLGHPRAHPGCCKTCGCATTCLLGAFHDALISSVIRELSRIGVIRGIGTTDCPRVDAGEKHGEHSWISEDPVVGPSICDGWSPDDSG